LKIPKGIIKNRKSTKDGKYNGQIRINNSAKQC